VTGDQRLWEEPSGVGSVVLNVDGASRGNPGLAAYGAVIYGSDGGVLAEVYAFIGRATNNVAEYRALIAGLERARDLGAGEVRVRADSKLVVEQMRGAWKAKDANMRDLRDQARKLARSFERVTYEHVRREFNKAADALANKALDQHLARGRTPGA
jgi:ribonuclease H / adenosylcobalamin/alpha-ribazole phosphatase